MRPSITTCRDGALIHFRGHDHDGGKSFTCTSQRAGLPDRGQVRRGRAFGTAMTASSDETTTITRDGRALPVEIFRPPTAAGPPPWPGVVVIHEIFGVNDDIRRIARRFAGAGYLAAVPDLMTAGIHVACVLRAMLALRTGAGTQVDDLEALLDALAARPDV